MCDSTFPYCLQTELSDLTVQTHHDSNRPDTGDSSRTTSLNKGKNRYDGSGGTVCEEHVIKVKSIRWQWWNRM
jgi:hypothetical protein